VIWRGYQIIHFNENKENDPAVDNKPGVKKLKDDIAYLLDAEDAALSAHQEVQDTLKQLGQFKQDNNSLNDIEAQLNAGNLALEAQWPLLQQKKQTQEKINSFNVRMTQLFTDKNNTLEQFNSVKKEIKKIEQVLDKQTRLNEQIPKGMLDVKRALRFNMELTALRNEIKEKEHQLDFLPADDVKRRAMQERINQLQTDEQRLAALQFSTSPEIDAQIKELLDDLNKQMSSGIQGYQDLAVSGGDINAFLHQTTAFYWETIFLYRTTLSAVNDFMKQAKPLTKEGNLIATCIKDALQKSPKQEDINTALKAVAEVDVNLSSRQKTYNQPLGNNQFIRFYRPKAHVFITTMLKKTDPFFFIPYNASNYALDHPAHTDLSGNLGNCYGEVQMFLLRINQKKTMLNNICPQTDLINFQLDQTRNIKHPEGKQLGTFEAETYGLITLSADPKTLNKEQLISLLCQKSSYALFNATLYFIDREANIIELAASDTDSLETPEALFPKEMDQQKQATTAELKNISKHTGHHLTHEMVKWDTIKDLLTQDVDSEKNGDVCWLQLAGAEVPAHSQEVGHTIGFIKMRDPSAYKYLVYDYNLGAMGFSNEDQLNCHSAP